MTEAIATKPAVSTFAVFKTSKGLRWISFSSNGYEDRDKEIVSTKALAADCERTKADGLYGPLRWWHCGHPDPLSLDEPWGPGIDLGQCDFSAMSGPFLVESGTFANDAIGQVVARKAKDLAISLGFFHPRSEPDASGVFHHIRRFERSLAPAGRVSNPLTAFYVPNGETMDAMQIKQLKALLGDAVPEAELTGLIEKYTSQAQKTAEDAGLRFKDDGMAQQIAALEAQIAALKSTLTPVEETAEKAPVAPPVAAEEEVETEEEEGGDYAGDMSIGDFKAIIAEAVKAGISGVASEMKALRTEVGAAGKIGNVAEEIKAMFGGLTSKDDSRATEIAALKQQQEALSTQLKTVSAQLGELLGDQPAAVASQSAVTAAVPVEGADKFEVTQKSGKPAYKSKFDELAQWAEGQIA